MSSVPHSQVVSVNDTLKTILAPYLHKREYGALAVLSMQPSQQESAAGIETPGWFIMYTGTTGRRYLAELRYDMGRGIFNYADNFFNKQEGMNAEEAERLIKRLPGLIQKQRKRDIADFALRQKKEGLGLEESVQQIKRISVAEPHFGPTEQELLLFMAYCDLIYRA